ncbi:hypothetical protein RJ639_044810 [Escallonia herrerae]|uniref:Aluminum-activated malate transporter n=1 Tax=Escallonia herrerae TaxID=1293975 RepID=A0AA88WEZ3_9ASTE|nr:hypothetical protein RJ639_044810 [Escallonia herrerae]
MSMIKEETAEPLITQSWCRLKALLGKLRSDVVELGSKIKKLGQEDPRRVIHSFKVGLAIALVSQIYYFEPLYEGFGVAAMWAVLTVVVIFEFTVGATLGKGINRGIATFLAGALGVGAHRLAGFPGERFEPILLGLSVFLVAAVVTFLRFFPKMKARYDYGLMIFILTFSLICVSGYQDDEVLDMAHSRLSTILIGGTVAVLVCISICPVWAGDDLNTLLVSNLEKLADFLDEKANEYTGFGAQYFNTLGSGQPKDLQAYKSVLNSKNTEESLVNFAKWEPRHGQFRYRHPWEQYLKIGGLTRQCANIIEALNAYLSCSNNQTTYDIRAKIQESCTNISSESSHALKELALAMKTMTRPSTANSHIVNAGKAAQDLKSMLRTGLWLPETDLLEVIPITTVASLLLDVVTCSEKIAESVNELASLAHFKNAGRRLSKQETLRPRPPIQEHHYLSTTAE